MSAKRPPPASAPSSPSTAPSVASLIRCAVNLGDQPRKLARAPHLFSGEILYGALESDGILPPFSAIVVQVS